MAHNLSIQKNGEASFFSVREKAWHGLGKIVQEAPTSEEAIKLAGLDYIVEKRPVHIIHEGLQVEVPNQFATTRVDNGVPFGIVGSRYEVLQNTEAFNFFDSIVGGKEAIYETAGALGQGERIFITAKMPTYIRLSNPKGGMSEEDLIEMNLFLVNHHVTGSMLAAFTPTRIVCNNTLNMALGNCVNQVRIQHRNGMQDKIKQAAELMGLVNVYQKEVEEVFNAMVRKPMIDRDLKDVILRTFATKEHLDTLAKGEDLPKRFQSILDNCYQYAMESPTQQMGTTKGTVFGGYNAITGYLQNVKEFKSAEAQLVSVLEGSSLDLNQKAFDYCKQFLA